MSMVRARSVSPHPSVQAYAQLADATEAALQPSQAKRSMVAARVRRTMEDFTRWTEKDVRQWVIEESIDDVVLEKELEKNLYALNEYDGYALSLMDEAGFLVLGISSRSRDLLYACLEQLREVEDSLGVKRRRSAAMAKEIHGQGVQGNGSVGADEVEAIVHRVLPTTTDIVKKVWTDGIIRFSDSQNRVPVVHISESSLMEVATEASKAEEMETEFKRLDKDGSGELDGDELMSLISLCFPDAGPTVRRKYYNAIMRECDRDGSNSISLHELFNSNCRDIMLRSELQDAALADVGGVLGGRFSLSTPMASRSATPAFGVRSSSPIGFPGGDLMVPSARSVSPSGTSVRSTTPTRSRCAPASPRLASRSGMSSVPTPRSRSPKVERLACDELRPAKHVSGGELMRCAEDILDGRALSSAPWLEALENFQDAARVFHESNDWSEAGAAHQRASDCHLKLGRAVEGAEALREAALCFREAGQYGDALESYTEAAKLFLAMGRHRTTAKLWFDAAEIYECLDQLEQAVDACLRCIPLVPREDPQLQYAAQTKAAQLYTRLGMYQDAYAMCVQTFEFIMIHNDAEGGMAILHPQLGAYVIVIAMLCMFAAVEIEEGEELHAASMKRADEAFMRFRAFDRVSKEHEFLHAILDSLRERSGTRFTNGRSRWQFKTGTAVGADVWMSHLLEAIRMKLQAA